MEHRELKRLFLAGVPLRAIGRRIGLSYTSIRYWVKKYALKRAGQCVSPIKNSPKRVVCNRCGRRYLYSRKNRKGHHTTQCNSCAANQQRTRVKERAVAYKGGKCSRCGYDRCLRSLVFHHREPRKKDFSVNAHHFCRSWAQLQQELDKCDLLCANCHGEVHHVLAQTE
jgi:hypothetical protein